MRYDHFTMLPIMAFRPRPFGGMTLEGGGGKGDAPDTPDYTSAAQATAQGNLEAARAAAAANRVNQYTPYGNLVYSHNPTSTVDYTAYQAALDKYNQDLQAYNSWKPNYTNGIANGGGLSSLSRGSSRPNAPVKPTLDQFTTVNQDDGWSATQTLSEAEQAKLDRNNKLAIGLLDTAQLGLSGVNEALSKGFNWDALPASQINAGQTAQDAIMARLSPKYAQDEEALRTRLIGQGVRAGSEAWDNEFKNFNQGKNDAYSQAALYGIDVGNKARQQALQEQEFGRTEGLNMVNALRTGNQVQQPTFVNTPQQATTAGADLLGAQQATYNSQLGAANAKNAAGAGLFGGLAQIGGSFLGSSAAPWWMAA